MPWFFQASYCVYVVHLMLGNLSSSRYWVYAILAFFSWTTYNFFFVSDRRHVPLDESDARTHSSTLTGHRSHSSAPGSPIWPPTDTYPRSRTNGTWSNG